MSLRRIVDALGGELYDGAARASVPGPNHGAEDRSVSLLLQRGRVVVNTFGRTDWKDVLDDLRKRGLIDRDNAPIDAPGVPVTGRPSAQAPTDRERLEAARRLWNAGRPLGTTLAARHCRLRGLKGPLPGPEALRFLHDAPVSVYRPGRGRRPALLAGSLDAAGVLVAVEVTYLAPNAKRAVDLHLPRKTVGVPPATGCAVRLDPAAEELSPRGRGRSCAAHHLLGARLLHRDHQLHAAGIRPDGPAGCAEGHPGEVAAAVDAPRGGVRAEGTRGRKGADGRPQQRKPRCPPPLRPSP
jgi:hypothetical protein